jgi:hypothetical protein
MISERNKKQNFQLRDEIENRKIAIVTRQETFQGVSHELRSTD